MHLDATWYVLDPIRCSSQIIALVLFQLFSDTSFTIKLETPCKIQHELHWFHFFLQHEIATSKSTLNCENGSVLARILTCTQACDKSHTLLIFLSIVFSAFPDDRCKQGMSSGRPELSSFLLWLGLSLISEFATTCIVIIFRINLLVQLVVDMLSTFSDCCDYALIFRERKLKKMVFVFQGSKARASGEALPPLQYLLTYLMHIRLTRTVQRNLLLVEQALSEVSGSTNTKIHAVDVDY